MANLHPSVLFQNSLLCILVMMAIWGKKVSKQGDLECNVLYIVGKHFMLCLLSAFYCRLALHIT